MSNYPTLEHQAAVIQAHIAGERISYRCLVSGDEGKLPKGDAIIFNFNHVEYCIIGKTGKERLVEDFSEVNRGFGHHMRFERAQAIIEKVIAGEYGQLSDDKE